jgi:hypothetical protein
MTLDADINGVMVTRAEHNATFTNEYFDWLDEVPIRGALPCSTDLNGAKIRQAFEDFRRYIQRRQGPGRTVRG